MKKLYQVAAIFHFVIRIKEMLNASYYYVKQLFVGIYYNYVLYKKCDF